MSENPSVIPVESAVDHRFELLEFEPGPGSANSGLWLYWLPGMGISARGYRPFARALAERGIGTVIHEWRGIGSSSQRASRRCNWGYRELLDDIFEGLEAAANRAPGRRWLIGGHSLGSQMAALALACRPDAANGMAIVAGGAPFWRSFPLPMKILLPGVFTLFSAISAVCGYYPGRRLGFAGNEARLVIADWTRSGWAGRYEPAGVATDLEAAMARLDQPVCAISMARDWFVPESSLDWLVGKMPASRVTCHRLEGAAFSEQRADHFGWMKEPGPVAAFIADWSADVTRASGV